MVYDAVSNIATLVESGSTPICSVASPQSLTCYAVLNGNTHHIVAPVVVFHGLVTYDVGCLVIQRRSIL